jgi:hypothetical protein
VEEGEHPDGERQVAAAARAGARRAGAGLLDLQNFSAQQFGSTVSTGSGSITVVAGGVIPPPPTLGIGFSGGNLTITWSHGLLLEANDVTGPWTTNTTATSPFTIVPSGPRQFYRVLGQ